jgi:hypothetical protein
MTEDPVTRSFLNTIYRRMRSGGARDDNWGRFTGNQFAGDRPGCPY